MIKLTPKYFETKSNAIYINPSRVAYVTDDSRGTRILFETGNYIIVEESLEEVVPMIEVYES